MKTLVSFLLAQTLICILAKAAVETYASTSLLYEVELRFVVTETTVGSRAQDLGNTSQRAYIKSQMDKILGQFGASVKFPSSDSTWVSDYAYEGAASDTGSRTSNDINWIFNNIPVSDYQPSTGVITVVFCERTPGFDYRGFYQTNGYAYIGGNGVTFFLGEGMIQNNNNNNMDIVAAVLAHEIGHNLNLSHINSHDNLMNPTIYEGYLEPDQTNAILDGKFTHGFFAQFGAPELQMSQDGNQLSFRYLRSADGVDQFTSSTLLSASGWAPESSSLNGGIYYSNAFSMASGTQRFFRVEESAVGSASAFGNVLTRALPPLRHETIGCSAVEVGQPSDKGTEK